MWKTFKTTALLLIVCLLGRTQAYAQINLSYENTPIKDVLKAIEKQTRFSFIYNSTVFDETDRVTIRVSNVSLETTLELLQKQLPIKWVRAGAIITVVRKVPKVDNKPPPPPAPPIVYLHGTVTDEQDEPVYGTTVYLKRLPLSVATNIDGKFSLPGVKRGDTVVFTNIGYESQELVCYDSVRLDVKLKSKVNDLVDVSVTSGIHRELKRRSTGATSIVDGKTLGRSTASNIIDRLEGVTPSFLMNRNVVPGANQSDYSVRGRSTIYANPAPLIVLDNFPYTGSLSSINPMDIESITVLRDAAASAIWGAFSGNGVIVITTKKGKYNQKTKVSFSSTLISGDKPDLYYRPAMSTRSVVELEEFLFDKNYYRFQETSPGRPALSPVVEVLIKKREGVISADEANRQLEQFKNSDLRDEIEKYLMQRSMFQQHTASLRGGTENNSYYLSVGYDDQKFNVIKTKYNRFTLNGTNTWMLLNKKLEINAGVLFSTSRVFKNNTLLNGAVYPYLKLKDEKGNSAIVPFDVRQPYKDTAGREVLLDWNLRPLDEAYLNDNKEEINSYRIDIGFKYKIWNGLQAIAMYQYVRETEDEKSLYSQATYYTRNLINKYTQIGSRGEIIRPIPLGDIFDIGNTTTKTHNVRLKLEYNKGWGDHEISAGVGTDVRGLRADTHVERLYGYNKNNSSSQLVDYETQFPMFQAPFLKYKIPFPVTYPSSYVNSNFIAVYGNMLYSYKSTYNASFSIRKDESNLFGVKYNQKGVPLWAGGVSWIVNNEKFYDLSWLPELKLRVTNGYNGNIDNETSAYTTAVKDGRNMFGAPTASISNPPNPSLRWERSRMWNFGVDFVFKNNRFSGSIDYFIRKSKDLIGVTPVDPTTGVELFKWNSSSMKGRGIDLVLHTKILKEKFKWTTSVLASYSLDKVHNYADRKTSIGFYLPETGINPLPGNPLYSVYALKWMGLDPNNGDPVGLLNGQKSIDYSQIVNSTNFDDLLFQGSAVPTYFGSFINTFKYKGLELTCMFTYKFGYYFRRSTVNYDNLILSISYGHSDYERRWQKPGDEKITTVPSFRYPTDYSRDNYYLYSEALIEKGDHVRLKDIRLSYSFKIGVNNKQPVNAELFGYVNNVGLVWKDNKRGIDPDYINSIPAPRTYSLGLRVDL